eukprot:6301963-Amphidinium_carterae.1
MKRHSRYGFLRGWLGYCGSMHNSSQQQPKRNKHASKSTQNQHVLIRDVFGPSWHVFGVLSLQGSLAYPQGGVGAILGSILGIL